MDILLLFADSIPISGGIDTPAFLNWLIGALFLLLATIIGWLVLQVNSSLKSLTENIDQMKINNAKMSSELCHITDNSKVMRSQIMTNTNDIGTIKGDLGVLKEWKRNQEKQSQ